MKIPYVHKFASEIDKYARESIKANYAPEILFEDMTKERKLPKLDMYVCGFPCQPFSTAGRMEGSKDPRGNIFMHCVSTIQQTNPSIFILENVKGIIYIDSGEYFKNIRNTLDSLTKYSVYYTLLNTRDYGIPQHRERLFIVGVLKSKIVNPFEVPKKVPCKDIYSYIDYSQTIREIYCDTYKRVYPQFKNGVFVTIGSLYEENNDKNKVEPRFASTIISSCPLWCIPMHRKATIKECLSLQGFPKNFKQVVSDTQMRKQIGNSMSVNVLCHLFEACLRCIDFC
jgi:DNA (cytosine-5)-methyltransferase 1